MLPRLEYSALNRTGMEDRLTEVQIDIVATNEDLASSLVAQLSAEVNAYQTCNETTVSGMDRAAKVSSYSATISVFEARGRLAALIAEQTLIERLLRDSDSST